MWFKPTTYNNKTTKWDTSLYKSSRNKLIITTQIFKQYLFYKYLKIIEILLESAIFKTHEDDNILYTGLSYPPK